MVSVFSFTFMAWKFFAWTEASIFMAEKDAKSTVPNSSNRCLLGAINPKWLKSKRLSWITIAEESILKVVPIIKASMVPSLKRKSPFINGWFICPFTWKAPIMSPSSFIIPGGVKAPATRKGNLGMSISNAISLSSLPVINLPLVKSAFTPSTDKEKSTSCSVCCDNRYLMPNPKSPTCSFP